MLGCTLEEDGTLHQVISAIRISRGMGNAHHGRVQRCIGDVRRRVLFSLLLTRLTEPILQERVSEAATQSRNGICIHIYG
jgi:hypothetical protein